jgi:hypothetical protein
LTKLKKAPIYTHKIIQTRNDNDVQNYEGGSNMKKKQDQYSKSVKSDGLNIEFSQELADKDDLEAQARSKAADARQKN